MDVFDFAALSVGDEIKIRFGGRDVRARVTSVRRHDDTVPHDSVRVLIPTVLSGGVYHIARDRVLERLSYVAL